MGRLSQEHPEPDPFLEAFEYFKEQQRRLDVESSITPEQVEEETRFGCLLSAEEIDQLVEEDAIRRRIQSTILMDIFFGLVIVANGAMMGLTTQGVVDESSDEAQIFELVCMAIFTVEFLLHWLAERCSGSHGCCGSLCRIMKDGWIQFDVLCVIMSWLDFFLTFVFNIGAGTSTFAVLRVVRLMRLLRLVRLLRILQQLWLLLSSMIASMRVLFWAIAMLAAICYIFGILVFTLSQNGSDPLMAAQWGGVLESMFSLAEIATYNGMEIIRKRTEGSDVLLFLPVLFIFMAITSMGIMNLIIGVLLTAVLERGNQDDMFEQTIMKLRQHRALRRLRYGLSLHADKTLGKQKDGPGSHLVTRRILQGWAEGPDVELKKDESTHGEDEDRDTVQEQIQDIQAGNTNMDALRGKGLGVRKIKKQGVCGRCCGALYSRLCAPLCAPFCGRMKRWTGADEPISEKEDLRRILPRLFNHAGVSLQDIDSVCEEVENLMGDNAGITIDEFVESLMFMKSRAHPLDIVGIMRGMWLVYERMVNMHGMFEAVNAQLDECRDFLSPLLQRFVPSEAVPGTKPSTVAADGSAAGPVTKTEGESQQKQLLLKEQEQRLIEQSQTTFDTFFALVLILNAVKLGVDNELRPPDLRDLSSKSFASPAMAWFTLESIFVLTFTAELFLRAIFKYQVEVFGEHELIFLVVPKIVTTMTLAQLCNVFLHSKNLLLDKMFLFDIVTVVVSCIDNFVLRFMGSGDNPALRLVGLIRLVRLIRLLHLVKDLARMVKGFVGNFRLIIRSVSIMTLFIYASSVLMVDFVGHNEETQSDAIVQEAWGHIPDCMITLFTMTTLSDWSEQVRHVAVYPSLETVMPVFTILFLAICSLGILNLVTGVMVQTAFALLKEEGTERLESRLRTARKAIHQVMDECFTEMELHLSAEQEKVKERVNQIRLKHDDVLHGRAKQRALLRANGGTLDSLDSDATAMLQSMPERVGGEAPTTPEKTQLPEEASWSASAFDDDNFAEVTRCVWVSDCEVAVDALLTLNPSMSPEAQNDPWQSQLMWDGGGKAWPCYVIEQEPPSKDDQDEDDGHGEAARRSRTILRTMIFRPVALSKVFHFRYGGNFTFVQVRSGSVPNMKFKKESELEDLTQVDRNLITIRELNYLLSDRMFARSLDLIDLRPDQALMVYQKLNLTNTERVKVHDFIEAIMRMKRPVQGLDVAVAKSLMRRLILEVEDLATNSVRCQDCFRGIAEKLREVEVVDAAEADAQVATTESRISRISAMSVVPSAKGTPSPSPPPPSQPPTPLTPTTPLPRTPLPGAAPALELSPKERSRQRAQTYYDDLLRRNRALEVKIASIKAFVQHARAEAEREESAEGLATPMDLGDPTAKRRTSLRERNSNHEVPRPRSCSPGWD